MDMARARLVLMARWGQPELWEDVYRHENEAVRH